MTEWEAYQKTLLTEDRNEYLTSETEEQHLNNEAIPELITEEELNAAIKTIKNNKATGSDNAPGELIKCGSRPLAKLLLRVYVR